MVGSMLCRNFTLQQVSLPLADITQSYRSNPDRTKEALHKVSVYMILCLPVYECVGECD